MLDRGKRHRPLSLLVTVFVLLNDAASSHEGVTVEEAHLCPSMTAVSKADPSKTTGHTLCRLEAFVPALKRTLEHQKDGTLERAGEPSC